MKGSAIYFLAPVVFCLESCISPSREPPKEVFQRIVLNSICISDMPGTDKNGNFYIWYIGSDSKKHYFGEYLKQRRLLFPFENNVTYVYVLCSEMTIEPEKQIAERLGSGVDVSPQRRASWLVPTSVPISKDVFSGPMVLATLIPAHEE